MTDIERKRTLRNCMMGTRPQEELRQQAECRNETKKDSQESDKKEKSFFVSGKNKKTKTDAR